MFYGDLRDYHNQKFFTERFDEFFSFLSTKGTLGFASLLLFPGYNTGDIGLFSAIFIETAVFDFITLYKHFNSLKNTFDAIDIQKNIIERKKIYKVILRNIKYEMDGLSISDPALINYYIYNLINSGYLSLSKKFIVENRREVNFNFAFNVIRGYGVCRNVSFITTDIFKTLGFEAYNLLLLCKDDNTKHAIVMVVHNNKIYFFDNLNNVTFFKDGSNLIVNEYNKFYTAYFDLPSSDSFYVFCKQLFSDSSNLERCEYVYHNYEVSSSNVLHGSLPSEIKRIYSRNKALYKRFEKTYH